MSEAEEGIGNPQLISKAGAILRALTPPRIATLLIVKEGVETQRQIAKRLDRAPPTISNYIETLEDLPTPLVKKDGHNYWTTSDGNQVASAILRFSTNSLGVDMQSESWDQHHLSQLGECLSPLHTFRSDPPFFVLYALGVKGSSGWMADPRPEPVAIDTVVMTVKDWLDDSIMQKKIRSYLKKFEEAMTIKIDDGEVTLTKRGLKQCQLLDQVMQLFASEQTKNSTNRDLPTEDEREIVSSDSHTVMYCAEEGPVLSLPPSITVGEFVKIAVNFGRKHDDDTNLDLKVAPEQQHNPVIED